MWDRSGKGNRLHIERAYKISFQQWRGDGNLVLGRGYRYEIKERAQKKTRFHGSVDERDARYEYIVEELYNSLKMKVE